jgi:GTP pyrophosphokinase
MQTPLTKLLSTYRSHYPKGKTALIKSAYEFAKEAHKGQERYSGEPYFNHARATAETLAEWGLGPVTIAAGLLHDVVDDTSTTLAQIEKNFGLEITRLVSGVSKAGGVKLRHSSRAQFVENLRQLFLVMAKDIRVVFVKLADRLHNMQTLDAVPLSKQRRIARETLEIYSPLAERVGMGELKGQLEDLSFPYLYPKEYAWVKKLYLKRESTVSKHLSRVKKVLKKTFENNEIKATIDGRTKHLYSLYRKLLLRGKDIEKIYDLVALRIVVDSVEDCYKALGVIHQTYRPAFAVAPIKDYIANPKPNGYQSIHTNVLGNNGNIFELQIRTEAMHEEAEYGLAAHWHYSEKKKSGKISDERLEAGIQLDSEAKAQLEWIQRLTRWQKEEQDPDEYLKTLKTDIFKKRILVLTPNSDTIDLPVGATPIDFAYEIHSELADCCIGSKVNGKIAPLSTKLQNGDIVEILKAKRATGPKRDWLKFVVTTEARSRIRKALRQ